MEKKTQFFKSLIDSELYINSQKLSKTEPLLFNIHALQKELKQFIRILQYLRRRKKKVIVFGRNIQILKLFNKLFKELNLHTQVSCQNVFWRSNNFKRKKGAILLEQDSGSQSQVLFNQGFFLINKFNNNYEKTPRGLYKINNNLNDFKSIIFISIILHKILKKTYAKRK